jgi:hypothetical protein
MARFKYKFPRPTTAELEAGHRNAENGCTTEISVL